MEKYRAIDTRKLLETLKQCVGRNPGPGLSPELRELIGFLKSQRLRHRNDAHAFCGSGLGMRILQELVEHCEGGQDCRDLVLVLGTIGNLCALGTEARQMVEKSSLEKTIGYLDSHSSPEVVSTVIRVLANLALDHTHSHTLHELGVVNKLSQLLSQSDVDLSCKISITRALRILCTNQDCRDELKWSKGVEGLTVALRSDNEDLASGAIQALEVVSTDEDILNSLSDKEVMQLVVKFCSHGRSKVKKSAQCVLLNAAKAAESRRSLSSAGGIETLVSLMEQSSAQNKGHQVSIRRVVSALCMCCRDAMSRQRLRDCGGLEKMIAMLTDEGHTHLHGSIMGALVAFYFDEITLKQMVTRMGLLRALNYHLQLLAKKKKGEQSVKEGEHGVGKRCEDLEGQELGKCVIGKGSPHAGMKSKVMQEVESDSDESVSIQKIHECEVGKIVLVGEESRMDGSELPDADKSEDSEVAEGMQVEEAGPAGDCGSQRIRTAIKRELSLEHVSDCEATPPPIKRSRHSKRNTPDTTRYKPITATPTSNIPANLTPIRTTPSSATPTSDTPPSLLDSLLSSPSPFASSQPSFSSPWTPSGGQSSCEPHTRLEGQVVMMVSRISHLKDCLHTLSYPDTLTTLLDYLTSDPATPNSYVFRVLSRVLANAHCFQNAVMVLAPSRIQTCLRKLHSKSEFPGKLVDDKRLVHPPPSSSSSSSTLLSKIPGKLANSPEGQSAGADRLEVMLRELLVCMNKNADCAYGQGVLEHLYLTGGERERHASGLAATLLCKNSRFCHRLLLDSGAYQLLSSMATNHGNSLHLEALDALLTLANNMIATHSKPHPNHSHSHTSHHRTSFLRRKIPFLDVSFQDLSITEERCEPVVADSDNSDHSLQLCRFRDTDHLPFDLTLVVHTPSSDRSPFYLQVHTSILAEESDVFKVMLGGHYKESSSGEVHIRSAPVCGFVAMVHFIYGCRWNCSNVRSQLTILRRLSSPDTEKSSDVIFEATNQLMADIIANCRCVDDSVECELCLQTMVCAGRFLLPDLIATCEHAAVQYISQGNVVAMFNLSQLHQCFCLAESCIRYILLMPHSVMRTKTFGDLLSSPEAEEALLILRMLLTFSES